MTQPQSQVALLSFTGGARNFIVRTNPNFILWSYQLRTHIDNTYGGRVIQILGVNFGTVSIEIEAGMGGLAEFQRVVKWFRDTSLWQRDNHKPIRMTYPERQYILDVYVSKLSIQDSLDNVLRPLQITFEIEDDFSRVLSGELINEELKRLNAGIGYIANPYNDIRKGFDAEGNIVDREQTPLPPGGGPLVPTSDL